MVASSSLHYSSKSEQKGVNLMSIQLSECGVLHHKWYLLTTKRSVKSSTLLIVSLEVTWWEKKFHSMSNSETYHTSFVLISWAVQIFNFPVSASQFSDRTACNEEDESLSCISRNNIDHLLQEADDSGCSRREPLVHNLPRSYTR